MEIIRYAGKENVDYFKELPLDLILNSRNLEGETFLTIVVIENHLNCCKVICERCPSLASYQPHPSRYTALQHAALRGRVEMMKLIITAGKKLDLDYQQDIESQGGVQKAYLKKTLMMRDCKGESVMHTPVYSYKPEAVKLLIGEDPDNELLRAADSNNDTPLHWAVGWRSNLEIAKLLIEADPDFPYGANSNGESPLFIAIKRAELDDSPDHTDALAAIYTTSAQLIINIHDHLFHNLNLHTFDMLKLILELQPSQCMVRVGGNGWTALHYAVSKGFITTVGGIIRCCPESSQVVDNEGQNFFHLAANIGDSKMVKHLLGVCVIDSSALNGKDNLGRTPLDVAALTRNENIIVSLLEDPRVDKKLPWYVEKHNFAMMNLLIEVNPGFLKELDLEVLLNSRDENGDTILFKAVQENHLLLCKEIYKRCPSLIYHQSKGGRTALHDAAWRGEAKMLKFLTTAGAKSYNESEVDNIESGGGEKNPKKMLLTMVDEQGDTGLHRAVTNHKLEAVRLLIEADPDFQYSANASGESPLMISVREAKANENKLDSGKIKTLLFKMMPNQAKVRTGYKDWTLLHHAAYNGDLSIVEDIIQFCPSCLELVDKEGKNFLHIAARLEKVQLVKHILSRRQIAENVLNGEDSYGNTPLHIAAITGNEALTRCFLFDPRVLKTTVNKNRQHVLHAITFSYDKRKAGVIDVLADTLDQSDLKDQRDFDLVVGALIATVSFTAGITVPGGYISEGSNEGMSVLSKNLSFNVFIISNNLALISSLYAVFSHFCARQLRKNADIIYQLNVAAFCTLASIYCMMVAFITGSFAVVANSNWLAIIVCVNSCTFFIFSCRPMWRIVMQHKRSTAASQHKSST